MVQNDRHRLPVRGERAQVPVVQRCVSVLLRLHDPGDEVGESDDAVDLEPVRGLDRVEVGEVEQHKAVEAVGGEPVAARDLQPVEERIRAVAPDGSLPGGRRRAAAAGAASGSGECVEERRFSGAGRAGESHDRRTRAQGPAARPPARRRHGRRLTASASSRPSARSAASPSAARRWSRFRSCGPADRLHRPVGAGRSAPLPARTRRGAHRSARHHHAGGARPAQRGPPGPARPACAPPGRRRSPRARF